MKIKFAIFSLICFILSISTSWAANDPVDLSLKLEKGKTYKYEQKLNQTISQTMMEMTQSTIQNITLDYDYLVEDVLENNVYQLKITFTRGYFYAYNDVVGKIEYDTDNKDEEAPEHLKRYQVAVGEFYRVKISNKGEVIEVYDNEAIVKNIISKLEIDEEDIEAVEEGLNAEYGEEAITQTLNNSFQIINKEDIKVGDTWTQDNSLEKPFPLKIDANYTFSKFKKNKAYFTVSSEISSDPENTAEINDMEIAYNLKGTQSADYIIDASTGLLYSSKVEQKIEGDMEIVSGMTSGQKIPMTIKTIAESRFY